MDERIAYADIPQTMRDLLDEVYMPEGVEIWWNSRHTTFDGASPADMWHRHKSRQRVIRWVEYLTGGAW